jgi:hydrogenase maturation protease
VSTLVIGYGNPLRRDDGFGYQVARRLAELLPADRADVIACHQLTPELAEPISRSELVIFVDARQGAEPGRVDWQELGRDRGPKHSRPSTRHRNCRGVNASPLPSVGSDRSEGPAAPFTHHVGPAALLVLARELYGSRPAAIVISVGGADFGYGTELSPTIEAAVPNVLGRIRELAEGRRAARVGAERG